MRNASERIAGLSPEKLELLLKRLVKKKGERGSARIERVSRAANTFPLSLAQKRLWFLEQMTPGTAIYNIPMATRLTGALDVAALSRALAELRRRHETLRTTFHVLDERPVQFITPTSDSAATGEDLLPIVDLQERPDAAREQEALCLAQEEARAPFDISQGPLLRAKLLKLGPEEHILLLTLHHLIADGWSLGVLLRELLILTLNATNGASPSLPELAVQYVDFAQWQRQQLNAETLGKQLSYWRKQLGGELIALELPGDRPRSAIQTYNGAQLPISLNRQLLDSLKAFSQREGATLFMTLLAAFKALLHRYTNETDIIIGSPIANRSHVELEGLIGLFVNTLAMRTDLSGDPTFTELLRRVREMALQAYAHPDAPFEKLVEELQPERDLSRSPLFQILFAHMNAPLTQIEAPGLKLSSIPGVNNGAAQFDLSLYLLEEPGQIGGFLEYNTDLFERATIERLRDHYQTLLAGALAQPDLRLSELPLLTAVEKQQLLVGWNNTAAPYPQDRTVAAMIAAQAAQWPDRAAVTFSDGRQPAASLTYRQLDQRANQLAHYLQGRGVGPDSLVGICVERSLDMMVGLLGILKAGGAFLPLDPAFPAERLDFMLADSQASLLVTQEPLLEVLPASQASPICLDQDWPIIAQEPTTEPLATSGANHLAYVIYTSGSTGRPKGVAIPQRALVNFLTSMQRQPGLTANDKLLAVTTLSFDIAMLELFLPLVTGAHLVVAGGAVVADGLLLQQQLVAQAVTVMQATPATWQMLLAAGWPGCPQLKIVCGGEALPRSLADQLLPRGASLWNMYGPTETTIWSTCCQVESGNRGWVSVGRPIANTQCYVLDEQRQPTPIGVAGELYIGGAGLAREYLNQPELTAEKFTPHPFDSDPSARLYRTGDRVCYLPDGSLRFLNRLDHQVKVRGYRIELGEIEKTLEQHPQVRQAVVTVREDAPGDKRLAGYILAQAGASPTVSELRRFLQRRLPDYMVVSTVVALDAFPLTPNGKVNRRALPKPNYLPGGTNFRPPRTPLEAQLAQLWQDILSVERVGLDDNFFDLGGHSLLATQLLFRVRDQLQLEIPVLRLFERPTVAHMAQIVETVRNGKPATNDALSGINLQNEVVLDPTILCPVVAQPPPLTEAANIFLTGATGFVGVYLLYELLIQTDAVIHCLARAADNESGYKRLQEQMTAYGLWETAFAPRIRAVAGDLAQAYFGLGEGRFNDLAQQVDYIFHSGATTQFIYPYRELKAINVRGTEEVLRLASRGRPSPVHYLSTLYVFSPLDLKPDQKISERDAPRQPQALTLGYTQSKWVAEQIVRLAGQRGLPVSIHRLGRVSGHSLSGACRTDDFLWQFIGSCLEIGRVPQLRGVVDMTPVDYVAQAVVQAAKSAGSSGNVFHWLNAAPPTLDMVSDWLRDYGYTLDLAPYEQWRADMMRAAATQPNSMATATLPFLSPHAADFQMGHTAFTDEDSRRYLDTAVSRSTVNAEIFNAYLTYFTNCGFLPIPQRLRSDK